MTHLPRPKALLLRLKASIYRSTIRQISQKRLQNKLFKSSRGLRNVGPFLNSQRNVWSEPGYSRLTLFLTNCSMTPFYSKRSFQECLQTSQRSSTGTQKRPKRQWLLTITSKLLALDAFNSWHRSDSDKNSTDHRTSLFLSASRCQKTQDSKISTKTVRKLQIKFQRSSKKRHRISSSSLSLVQ